MPQPIASTQRPGRGWTLVIVSIGLFMVVLDNLVVNTALPSIHRDLGGGIDSLEWTVNAYTLSFAVLLLTGAALGDRFGRRRMFSVGLAVFTIGSAAAALAPSIVSPWPRSRSATRRQPPRAWSGLRHLCRSLAQPLSRDQRRGID